MGDSIIKEGCIVNPNVHSWVEDRVRGGRHVENTRRTIGTGAPAEGDVSFELAVEDRGHCKERIGAKMLVIYFGSIALAPGVWAHSS